MNPVSAPPTSRSRIALTIVLLVLALGFLALAWWQVERRAWKLELIDRVEQRVHAPAVAAPALDAPAQQGWSGITVAGSEYLHVKLSGIYADVPDTLVQAVSDLGAGYWVLSPLKTADGGIVMINRGFVPQGSRPLPADRAPTSIQGLLRMPEPGGGFLRKNDPAADRWYSRDVQAIGQARGVSPVAPYFVDEEAPLPQPAQIGQTAAAGRVAPVPGLTVISFHNSHLVYALTWCTLALLAAAAAFYIHRRDTAEPENEGPSRH